jgi:hypothetical protein|tara:strand:+ start:2002 stop:2247 length:246 start_codon:yes stop_codon:yes gene_type:complete
MHENYDEEADLVALALTLSVMDDDDENTRKFKVRLFELTEALRLPADQTTLDLTAAIVAAYDRRQVRLTRTQRETLDALRG